MLHEPFRISHFLSPPFCRGHWKSTNYRLYL